MAQQILFKRSSTASSAPVAGDMAGGQLAINTYDGKLFLEKNGTVVEIEPDLISTLSELSDLTDVTITSAVAGEIIRYNGSAWVNASPSIVVTNVFTAADETAQLALSDGEGDLIVRSDESKTYIKNAGSAGTMADYDELQLPLHVQTVNSQSGVVILNPDDLDDAATTAKFFTAAQLAKADFITVTEAVDLDALIYDGDTVDFGEFGGWGETHYLTGFSDSNYVTLGAPLAGLLDQTGTWSVGFFLPLAFPTTGAEMTIIASDDAAIELEADSATSWFARYSSDTTQGSFNAISSEPTQVANACMMIVNDGTLIKWYYNGTEMHSHSSTLATQLPADATGNITFGKPVIATADGWDGSMSGMFISNEVLAASISSTASSNSGDIRGHADYSKVDAYVTVGASGVTDHTGNFTPSIVGTLTHTAK